MKKTFVRIGLVLVLSLGVFIQNATAFESRKHEDRNSARPQLSRGEQKRHDVRSHHHPRYERHLPAGYRTLRMANRVLYYLNGIFYQSTPYGYQVITAPMGTVVRELPYGCYQVWQGGTVYYVFNNTYYTRGPMGYRVVMPPARGIMFPVQARW